MINFYEEFDEVKESHKPVISEEDMTDEQVMIELKNIREELGERVVVLGLSLIHI